MDILERNHQVRLMGNIYQSAMQVVVWLGEASRYDLLAMELISGPKRYGEDWSKERALKLAKPIGQHSWVSWTRDADFRNYRSKTQWSALANLCRKPYWSRTWIIQEFMLARSIELRCGQSAAELRAVCELCSALEGSKAPQFSKHSASDVLQTPGWTLIKQRACMRDSQLGAYPPRSSFSLQELLETYEFSLCADRRDKVYALLILASDVSSGPYELSADYSKTREGVFVDVMRNQRKWNDTRFTCLLQRILAPCLARVEHHILQHAPDLRPHLDSILTHKLMDDQLYRIWRCNLVQFPIRYVGEVLALDFNITSDGISSTRTFWDWKNRHFYGKEHYFIEPARLTAAAISDIQSRRDDAIVLDRAAFTCVAIDNANLQRRLLEKKSEISGLENLIEACGRALFSAIKEHGLLKTDGGNQNAPRIFIGSNGYIGFTSRETKIGDGLFLLQGESDEATALVLRRRFARGFYGRTYTVTGAAILVKQATIFDSHHPKELLLPQSQYSKPIYHPKQRISNFNNPVAFRPPDLGSPETRFYFHPSSELQWAKSERAESLHLIVHPWEIPSLIRAGVLKLSGSMTNYGCEDWTNKFFEAAGRADTEAWNTGVLPTGENKASYN